MTKLSVGFKYIPASRILQPPQSIDDLIDFIIARILDHLDLDHQVGKRWTGDAI